MKLIRKASNVTTTTTSTGGNNNNNNQNGLMKLLMIKLRATKVRKLFSSLFTKSRGQVNYLCNPNKLENDISYTKRSSRPYASKEKPHVEYYHEYDTSQRHRLREPCKAVRAMEVNLGGVRGVLEAMNMSGARGVSGRNKRKTSSCPSSIKSSPIHQGFGENGGGFCGGENSIRAAIAHCKSSLGQSSEFRI